MQKAMKNSLQVDPGVLSGLEQTAASSQTQICPHPAVCMSK
jgi:hypothetical protein